MLHPGLQLCDRQTLNTFAALSMGAAARLGFRKRGMHDAAEWFRLLLTKFGFLSRGFRRKSVSEHQCAACETDLPSDETDEVPILLTPVATVAGYEVLPDALRLSRMRRKVRLGSHGALPKQQCGNCKRMQGYFEEKVMLEVGKHVLINLQRDNRSSRAQPLLTSPYTLSAKDFGLDDLTNFIGLRLES